MKKTFAFVGLLALLSMASCGRKQACPAYGSVQKPVSSPVRV